jgi:hypothetical protein
MQPTLLCRVFAALVLAGSLVNCSRPAENPYAGIQNPPLVRATLHTVTVVTPDAALAVRLDGAGYMHTVFPSNYPSPAVTVEAALWKVPEESAANSVIFMAPIGRGPNARMVFMPDPPPIATTDEEVEATFFRNVLGTEVPQWPGSSELRNGARVQAWTFLVDDVLAASKRLREAGIPVTMDPVAMTSAYLGDHKTMGIQGPGGIAIQLVQNAAR